MKDKETKIIPLEDRVLIQGLSDLDTSHSGIIIPDTASKDRPQKGKILAVGPGKTLKNGQKQTMHVKVGDIVLFSKYAPDEIKVGDEEFIIAREDHILAIIQN